MLQAVKIYRTFKTTTFLLKTPLKTGYIPVKIEQKTQKHSRNKMSNKFLKLKINKKGVIQPYQKNNEIKWTAVQLTMDQN